METTTHKTPIRYQDVSQGSIPARPPYVSESEIKKGYVFWGEEIKILRQWPSDRRKQTQDGALSSGGEFNFVYRATAYFRHLEQPEKPLQVFSYETSGHTNVNPLTHWLFETDQGLSRVARPANTLLFPIQIEREKQKIEAAKKNLAQWARKGNEEEDAERTRRKAIKDTEARAAEDFKDYQRHIENLQKLGIDAGNWSVAEYKKALDAAEAILSKASEPMELMKALRMLTYSQFTEPEGISGEERQELESLKIRDGEIVAAIAARFEKDVKTRIAGYKLLRENKPSAGREGKGMPDPLKMRKYFKALESELQYLMRLVCLYARLPASEDFQDMRAEIMALEDNRSSELHQFEQKLENSRGVENRGIPSEKTTAKRGIHTGGLRGGVAFTERGILNRGVPS